MSVDPDRRTGRTTRQIKEAPKDAIFVAGTLQERDYARRIACDLGRIDIRFETSSFFGEGRWHGMRRPVIIDHAAWDFFKREDLHQARHCLEYLRMTGVML